MINISPVFEEKFRKVINLYSKVDWVQKELIGQGNIGAIYKVCIVDDCEYAMKIQEINDDNVFYNEVITLHQLQSTGAVPKLYSVWTANNMGYYIMEMLYKCNNTNSIQLGINLLKAIDLIHEAGCIHNDIHQDNYMCTQEGKAVIIDFGFSFFRDTEDGIEKLEELGEESGEDDIEKVFNDLVLKERYLLIYFYANSNKNPDKKLEKLSDKLYSEYINNI